MFAIIVAKWQILFLVLLLFNCVRFINLENGKLLKTTKKSIAKLRRLFGNFLFLVFFPLVVFLVLTNRLSTQDPATKPQNIFIFLGVVVFTLIALVNTFRIFRSRIAKFSTYSEVKKFLLLDYFGFFLFVFLAFVYNT